MIHVCVCVCACACARSLSLSVSLSLSLCLSVCLSVSLSRPHCASLPFFTAHTRRMFFFSFLFLVVCSAIVNSASGLALAGISEYFSVSRAAHSSQVYRVCGSGLEVIVAHHPLLWPSFSFPSFPLADLPSRPLLFNDCMQTLSELVSYYETHYIPLPHPYRQYPFVQITCLVHDWPRRSLRPPSDDRCPASLGRYSMQSDLLLVLEEQTERRRTTSWPRHER